MDVSKYFDEEYQNILRDIQENWERNLNRNIANDIRRDSISKSPNTKQFQDVAVTKDLTNIQLKNITLKTRVTVDTGEIHVDFLNACLHCDFKLKELLVTAELSVFKCELQEMAMQQADKVHFRIIDTAITGRIGLLHNQDSLMPVNYDLIPIPKEILTIITSISTDTPTEIKTSISAKVEETMVEMFWMEVKEFIMRNFTRMISRNVVEYSFGEMFLDEPRKYKQFEKQRICIANQLFDEQLKKFLGVGFDADMPALQGYFQKGGNMHHLQADCAFKDLTSLKRMSDASLFENEDETIVYARVKITDFKFEFGECVITAQNEAGNQIKAGVMKIVPDRNRIYVKFQMPKRGEDRACRVHLDIVEIELNGMHLSGEQANYVFEDILPYAVGYVMQHTEGMLQKYVEMFNAPAGN